MMHAFSTHVEIVYGPNTQPEISRCLRLWDWSDFKEESYRLIYLCSEFTWWVKLEGHWVKEEKDE
jgi:hypothetical protein